MVFKLGVTLNFLQTLHQLQVASKELYVTDLLLVKCERVVLLDRRLLLMRLKGGSWH